jgi:hypothetical protein
MPAKIGIRDSSTSLGTTNVFNSAKDFPSLTPHA